MLLLRNDIAGIGFFKYFKIFGINLVNSAKAAKLSFRVVIITVMIRILSRQAHLCDFLGNNRF